MFLQNDEGKIIRAHHALVQQNCLRCEHNVTDHMSAL